MNNLRLEFKWYELLLALVEIGLVAFGLWPMFDAASVGAPHAGWRFLFLFVIWALPGAVVLFLFRSRKGTSTASRPKFVKPESEYKGVTV